MPQCLQHAVFRVHIRCQHAPTLCCSVKREHQAGELAGAERAAATEATQ